MFKSLPDTWLGILTFYFFVTIGMFFGSVIWSGQEEFETTITDSLWDGLVVMVVFVSLGKIERRLSKRTGRDKATTIMFFLSIAVVTTFFLYLFFLLLLLRV